MAENDIFKVEAPFVNFYKSKEETEDLYLGYVEGFATTSDRDRFDDIISEGALRKSAKQLKAVGTVFLNHKYHDPPVGIVLDSRFRTDKETETKGIFVKAGISKTATNIWTLIQEGILKSFSIGGRMRKTEFDEEQDARIVKEMDLYEVSIVGMPANPHATFDYVAKSFIEKETQKDPAKEEVAVVKKPISLQEFIFKALESRRGTTS